MTGNDSGIFESQRHNTQEEIEVRKRLLDISNGLLVYFKKINPYIKDSRNHEYFRFMHRKIQDYETKLKTENYSKKVQHLKLSEFILEQMQSHLRNIYRKGIEAYNSANKLLRNANTARFVESIVELSSHFFAFYEKAVLEDSDLSQNLFASLLQILEKNTLHFIHVMPFLLLLNFSQYRDQNACTLTKCLGIFRLCYKKQCRFGHCYLISLKTFLEYCSLEEQYELNGDGPHCDFRRDAVAFYTVCLRTYLFQNANAYVPLLRKVCLKSKSFSSMYGAVRTIKFLGLGAMAKIIPAVFLRLTKKLHEYKKLAGGISPDCVNRIANQDSPGTIATDSSTVKSIGDEMDAEDSNPEARLSNGSSGHKRGPEEDASRDGLWRDAKKSKTTDTSSEDEQDLEQEESMIFSDDELEEAGETEGEEDESEEEISISEGTAGGEVMGIEHIEKLAEAAMRNAEQFESKYVTLLTKELFEVSFLLTHYFFSYWFGLKPKIVLMPYKVQIPVSAEVVNELRHYYGMELLTKCIYKIIDEKDFLVATFFRIPRDNITEDLMTEFHVQYRKILQDQILYDFFQNNEDIE